MTSKRRRSRARLAQLVALALAAALTAAPAWTQSSLPSFTPSVRTSVIGDPAALFIPPDIFDKLLAGEINRRLSRAAEPQGLLDRPFAIDGTLRATKSEATWSGCLFFVDAPPVDGDCPYPIAPVTYDGPASIETVADRVTKEILQAVRPGSSIKTLYLGCRPMQADDAIFQFALMIFASTLERATTSLVDVETATFAIACTAEALPASSALLDFGVQQGDETVVLAPSLTIAGQPERKLPSFELPIEEGDALTILRKYGDELTRFYAGTVVSRLLPNRPSAPNDPERFDDPTVAARSLRNAGYLKLAETFLTPSTIRRKMATGVGDVDLMSVRFERGMLLLERGELDSAFEHLRDAVGRDPDPNSAANSAVAYRALVDAAFGTRRYGESIKAGERALSAPQLTAPDASEDALALRQRLADAYILRAAVCLDGRDGCREESDKTALTDYGERLGRATGDVSSAVQHLTVLSEADPNMAASVSTQADFLAQVILSAVDASKMSGASEQASGLLDALRSGIHLVDDRVEERKDVLLGRTGVLAGAISAPADSELARASERFRHARARRDARIAATGVVQHPLLDFEIAEVLAMRQQFDAAHEAALTGKAFLEDSVVKNVYASRSWEVLTALFGSLAALSKEGQSAEWSTVVDDFRQTLESTATLPSIQAIPESPDESPTMPLVSWNFDPFYVYACMAYEGEVQKATLAMLDLIVARQTDHRLRVPECSDTVQP